MFWSDIKFLWFWHYKFQSDWIVKVFISTFGKLYKIVIIFFSWIRKGRCEYADNNFNLVVDLLLIISARFPFYDNDLSDWYKIFLITMKFSFGNETLLKMIKNFKPFVLKVVKKSYVKRITLLS